MPEIGLAASLAAAGGHARLRLAAALVLAFACLHAGPAGADEAATRVLIDQAQYWQSKGRSDRAAESWKKLLRIDPRSAEALFGLGLADVDAKNTASAQAYLERLRQVAPASPYIARLDQAIRSGGTQMQLGEARALARSGKADEAMTRYRQVFGERAPDGPQALEYYQTLGATAAGWEEARTGLERLNRENPQDRKIALAYAEHLTYRESTRREGIDRLTKLSAATDVGKNAETSWRRAISWLPSKPSSLPLIEAYLERYPDDEELQSRVSELSRKVEVDRAASARDLVRRRASEGFRRLDADDIAAATVIFRSILAERPGDPDALGGLGLVRLREERFAEAQDFLERASRAGSPERWRDALASATYWSLVSSAEAQRSANPAAARAALERAVTLKPSEVAGLLMLAGILDGERQLPAAEANYRRVLQLKPDDPDAIRGLVGILSRTGRGEEALRTVDQLSPEQQDKIGAVGALRAEQLRLSARAAIERGDYEAARPQLEDAVSQDPGNLWARYDLAAVVLKLSGKREAREVISALDMVAPDAAETRYVQALFAAETREWAEGLRLMEEIPYAARTADVISLQKRLWINLHADQAIDLARAGRRPEALSRLSAAERQVGKDADLASAVASAYAEIGDAGRAMAVLRGLMSATAKPSPSLRLQFASILFKTGQDRELVAQLRQLQTTPMSPQDRLAFDKLRRGHIVRQVESLRKSGNLVAAYDMLAPSLVEGPDDVTVQSALARLYTDAGQTRDAAGVYETLLRQNPDDKNLTIEAAGAATTAREFAKAEGMLRHALTQWPEDPDLLAALGRSYRSAGKNLLAAEYLEASVQAEQQRLGRIEMGRRSIASGVNRNPFERNAASAMPTEPLAGRRGYGDLPAGGIYIPAPVGAAQPDAGHGLPTARYAAPTGGGYPGAPVVGYPPVGYPPVGYPPTGPSASDPAGLAAFPDGRYAPAYPVYPAGPAQPLAPLAIEQLPPPVARGLVSRSAKPAGAPAAEAAGSPRPIRPAARQPGDYGRLERQATYCDPAPQGAIRTASIQPGLILAAAGQECAVPGVAPKPRKPAVARAPSKLRPRLAEPQLLPERPQSSQLPQPVQRSVAAGRDYLPMPEYLGGSAPSDYAAPAPLPVIAQAQAPARASTLPTIEDEINELRSMTVSQFAGTGQIRTRQGEAGMGRLTELQSPLEWSQGFGDGRLVFGVTPVTLDSGRLGTAYNDASRFGGGPADALRQLLPDGVSAPGVQAATGVGFNVAYIGSNLSADVGSTPLGFEQTNVVGGLRYKWPLTENLTLTTSASRRAINESLLSFAGTTDPRSGLSWGGVTATGGRVDLNWDDGRDGAYGYAGYYLVDGNNVASNTRIEGGLGLYTRLHKTPDSELTIGTSLTALGYDENLRYFTFGHGGYFSPQSYVVAGVPVTWNQRYGRWAFQARGSLGFQYFREDDAPYFPTDPVLQLAALAASANPALPAGSLAGATYQGQASRGVNYALGLVTEYTLSPQVRVGAMLAADNATDFRQMVGGFYFRFPTERVFREADLRPNPVRSPYGY